MSSSEFAQGFTALVLAGGKSSRMGGVDKTLLEVDGRSLTGRVVDVVRPLFREVIVASGVPGKFADLDGVREVADHERGIGPLAGMLAGLEACRTEWAFVVAADMPCLKESLIRRVVESATPGVLAAAPRHDRYREPLHAAYHRDVIVEIERFLDEGRRSVNRLLDQIPVTWVDVDDADL
ncbi:MAG: molybdenum cofactor guanylyltransferase, partial [Deltaproteobacteria bacterium]|nr:molybdenum cofactor guanylyltransferase [Deltaproteobacteria bacterium]